MIKTLNCVSLRIKDHQNHTHDRRRVFKSIDDKITIYLSLFICFVRGDDGIKSGIGTFDPYPKISETRVFKYILYQNTIYAFLEITMHLRNNHLL